MPVRAKVELPPSKVGGFDLSKSNSFDETISPSSYHLEAIVVDLQKFGPFTYEQGDDER